MNKYEILDMIDQGAYGIVWKALNRQTGILVAIKEFKDSDEDQLTKKNIQRQIRMLKMLKGQFIVNIKEAFKKKNKTFLIFQYFPKNLLNYIEIYDRGLDGELINKIVYKTIKCLRFLHQKNILHRDIKPQNILLQANADDLKLCDFGFARFLPQKKSQLTQYVATRWYRSPELLVGEGYGKPADIWALGCIIGELVDGQPMFAGQNQMDQIYLIRKNLGQITDKQITIMKRNPKFFGISFPQIKKFQTVQSRYLGRIQKKALNFMKMCLIIDPQKRITVDQALNHPYLLPFSTKDNQLINDQTNILQSHRKFHIRNQSKFLQQIDDKDQSTAKTKLFTDKSSLKVGGGISLPENSIYKAIQKPNKLPKKNSQANLQSLNMDKIDQRMTKKKFNHESSPKLKAKKASIKKMSKVMSEEKKINYNIDVKLNINLKINEKLNHNKLQNSSSNAHLIKADNKLPQIKTNNSKILKYRLNNLYPGKGVNTIYNNFGNLSILGQTKQLNKAAKKN